MKLRQSRQECRSYLAIAAGWEPLLLNLNLSLNLFLSLSLNLILSLSLDLFLRGIRR